MTSKEQKQLKNNNALYECIYCQIVANNDYIKDLKESIKDYQSDLKKGDIFISIEHMQSHIKNDKERLKEYRKKQKQLKQASKILFDDDFSDYNA